MSNFENELRDAHTQLCTPSVVELGEEKSDGSHGWFRSRFVGEHAVVGILQEDDPGAELANCAKSVALAAFPDGPSHIPSEKKSKRVVRMPFELHTDGIVRVGGMHNGGSYRVIGAKDHVKGDDRTAILTRRGETVFGDDVDEGMDVRPVGKSARLDVSADKTFSAFFAPERRQNGIFLKELDWLFSSARARIGGGSLNEGSGLDGFVFLVAPGPNGLAMRWDNDLCPNRYDALRAVVNETKRRAQDGSWSIPGFSELTAGVEGKVLAVDGKDVIIGTEDGGKLSIGAPVEALRRYIESMTLVSCDDLPVVPIVWPGKTVGPDTCLFGPVERQATNSDDNVELLEVDGGVDGIATYHRMRQVYAWATLACGKQHTTGHELYPLVLVEPDDLRRTFVRLSGRDDRSEPWDGRVQVNLLSSGVSTVLRGRGIGYEINLFDHSQRSLMLSQIRRTREARNAGAGKDKPRKAANRKTSKPKRGRRKAAAKKVPA